MAERAEAEPEQQAPQPEAPRETTEYTVDQQTGSVGDVKRIPVNGRIASVAGPTARRAHLRAVSAMSREKLAELNARRTAILEETRARRRAVRERELAAAMDKARAEAGNAEDHVRPDWVVASSIIVPPEYQREFKRDRAMGIVLRFRWRKFGAVHVNRRPDGTLAMVDGQHRAWAAQRLFGPDVKVPCVFTAAATTPEEAEDFVDENTVRAGLSYNAGFRAKVHANDERALRVLMVLREHGLRPLWPGENRGEPGTVTATRTVGYMIAQGGVSSARAVLSLLKEVGGTNADWYRDFLLGGMWQFILRYDGYARRDRVVKVLKDLDDPKTLDRITAEKRSGVNSSISAACCGAIHWLYNRNMKMADALPPYSVETASRQNTMIKRYARRWVQQHEPNGSGAGAKRSGIWAPGGQAPSDTRRGEQKLK